MSTGIRKAKCVVLGCGTSTGVPLIGCPCAICTSNDPRNKRLRASIWLDLGVGARVLVDASTDLRQQSLDNAIPGVDLVLFTHTHADHVHGMDDLRMFNFLQLCSIPCYGTDSTRMQLEDRFRYIFKPEKSYPSALPRLELHALPARLKCGAGEIITVPILHGREEIVGFRFGEFAYLTDVSGIPEASRDLLSGIRLLIIGALRHDAHPTHLTVAQAIEVAADLGVEEVYFTHMSHNLEYSTLKQELPPHVSPCYDGQVLYFDYH